MSRLRLALSCLLSLALGPVAGLSESCLAATSTPLAERPNILILFTDDQRPDAIAALGHPVLQTPNMDRIYQRGTAFTNAYCLGSNSGAVCLPSRNMLLSGRAYFRWDGPYAPAEGPNLPDTFKAAGYETYHHGKRGNVALKIQERFDHNKYLKDDAERTSGRPGETVVNEAIAFLNHRESKQPFLMYLAFEAPHDPRVPAPGDLELYPQADIPLPANFLPLHPFDNGEMTVRDERLAPWPRTEAEIRHQLQEYYGVITGLDRNIGRLLETLEKLGLTENTIIVFASDNGLAIGSHGLMGKQSLYDHSMRVPLAIAGPGVPAGRSTALVYLLDLYPTLCDLAGIPIPDGLDGQSLVPVLKGQKTTMRETLFTSYRDVQRALRDDRYKLIRYPRINRTQLFDLATDPDELHDISADPSMAARIDRMIQELSEWQKRLGDSTPLTSENPAPSDFQPPQPTPDPSRTNAIP